MSRPRQPILEHARLLGPSIVLRPLSVDDIAAAFPLVHERREITDWLIWDGPATPAEMVPWYEHWADVGPDGGSYHFAIVEREGGEFCGSIGLRFRGHEFQGDLGYWLARDKWGRGYMTEAVGMLVWLAFEHLQAQLCYALAFEDNRSSRRVLEKCGLELDPSGRNSVRKRGAERFEDFFALSRTGWVRAGRPGAPEEHELRLAERAAAATDDARSRSRRR